MWVSTVYPSYNVAIEHLKKLCKALNECNEECIEAHKGEKSRYKEAKEKICSKYKNETLSFTKFFPNEKLPEPKAKQLKVLRKIDSIKRPSDDIDADNIIDEGGRANKRRKIIRKAITEDEFSTLHSDMIDSIANGINSAWKKSVSSSSSSSKAATSLSVSVPKCNTNKKSQKSSSVIKRSRK